MNHVFILIWCTLGALSVVISVEPSSQTVSKVPSASYHHPIRYNGKNKTSKSGDNVKDRTQVTENNATVKPVKKPKDGNRKLQTKENSENVNRNNYAKHTGRVHPTDLKLLEALKQKYSNNQTNNKKTNKKDTPTKKIMIGDVKKEVKKHENEVQKHNNPPAKKLVTPKKRLKINKLPAKKTIKPIRTKPNKDNNEIKIDNKEIKPILNRNNVELVDDAEINVTDDNEDKSKLIGNEDQSKMIGNVDKSKIIGNVDKQKIIDNHKKLETLHNNVEKSKFIGNDNKSRQIGNDDDDEDEYGLIGDDDRFRKMSDDDKSRPIGNDDKFRPIGNDDKFRPIGNDDKFKPIGNDDKFRPIGNDDKFRPMGNDDKFRSNGNNDKFRPIGNDDKFRPIGNDDKFRPISNDDKFRPIGNDDKFRPIGNNDKFRPIGDNDKFRLISNDDKIRPIGNDNKFRLIGNNDKFRPIGNDDKFRPIGNDDKFRPIGNDNKAKLIVNDDKSRLIGNDDKFRLMGNDENFKLISNYAKYKPENKESLMDLYGTFKVAAVSNKKTEQLKRPINANEATEGKNRNVRNNFTNSHNDSFELQNERNLINFKRTYLAPRDKMSNLQRIPNSANESTTKKASVIGKVVFQKCGRTGECEYIDNKLKTVLKWEKLRSAYKSKVMKITAKRLNLTLRNSVNMNYRKMKNNDMYMPALPDAGVIIIHSSRTNKGKKRPPDAKNRTRGNCTEALCNRDGGNCTARRPATKVTLYNKTTLRPAIRPTVRLPTLYSNHRNRAQKMRTYL